MNGKIGLALILILASFTLSVFAVKPVCAQSTPTPSTPQFTIKKVSQGENSTIELLVQNQQLSFQNSSYHLYYDVRTKLDSLEVWGDLYPLVKLNSGPPQIPGLESIPPSATYLSDNTPAATNATYTVISLPQIENPGVWDYQVEAIVGHDSYYFVESDPIVQINGYYLPAVAYDAASGWSATQTITVPSNSISVSPSATPPISPPSSTFTSPNLTVSPSAIPTEASSAPSTSFWQIASTIALIAIAILLAAIFALLVYFRKRITLTKPS